MPKLEKILLQHEDLIMLVAIALFIVSVFVGLATGHLEIFAGTLAALGIFMFVYPERRF
jgi:hypothetical protein